MQSPPLTVQKNQEIFPCRRVAKYLRNFNLKQSIRLTLRNDGLSARTTTPALKMDKCLALLVALLVQGARKADTAPPSLPLAYGGILAAFDKKPDSDSKDFQEAIKHGKVVNIFIVYT